MSASLIAKKPWLGTLVPTLLVLNALVSGCNGTPPNDATAPSALPAVGAVISVTEPNAVASPGALPLLDPTKALPLAPNNTWVYQLTRYEGFGPGEIMTTTLVITDSVVEVKRVSAYFIARVRRDEGDEKLVAVTGSMPGASPRPSTSSQYWFLVSKNRIYQQQNNPDPSDLSEALLKFEFPLQLGATWYQVGNALPRRVIKSGNVIVPAGHFDNCYVLQEQWADATLEDWFCPNVGIVDQKSEHNGRPEGFHQVLLRDQLNH